LKGNGYIWPLERSHSPVKCATSSFVIDGLRAITNGVSGVGDIKLVCF
jgi:hypothetical protein